MKYRYSMRWLNRSPISSSYGRYSSSNRIFGWAAVADAEAAADDGAALIALLIADAESFPLPAGVGAGGAADLLPLLPGRPRIAAVDAMEADLPPPSSSSSLDSSSSSSASSSLSSSSPSLPEPAFAAIILSYSCFAVTLIGCPNEPGAVPTQLGNGSTVTDPAPTAGSCDAADDDDELLPAPAPIADDDAPAPAAAAADLAAAWCCCCSCSAWRKRAA